MKEFFKIVFGNLVAMGLFLFFGMVFLIVVMVGLFMEEPETRVESNSVMVFDMNVALTDAPPGAELWRLLQEAAGGLTEGAISSRKVVEAIERAAADDRIAAIHLQGSFIPTGVASGFPQLHEVREALLEFRQSGKPVVAYLQSPTVRDYYVASAADRVVLDPYGAIALNGLASQQIFLAGLLEKYGVEVQVARVGEFKSATELFTETEMSDANRAQTRELLSDMWEDILTPISEARGLTVDQLQALVDREGFIMPDLAVEEGLADGVGYFDEILGEFREMTGTPPDGDLPQITLAAYQEQAADRRRGTTGDFIAVVYLEGDMMDGAGKASLGADTYAREIRRLRTHPDVRGMVVRVNSPGGAVTAAEKIQREIGLANREMPVAVSFGTFAASGGYWVAVDSDRIFAHPHTITGSIGVFGILPNFHELANRHGVTFDVEKTGVFADIFTPFRTKSEEEMEVIQGFIDQVYEDFLDRVARGRDLSIEEVRQAANGRVWSGRRAVEQGLVDELGGLSDAVGFVAAEAGLETWDLHEYPRPPRNFGEMLAQWFDEEDWQPLAGNSPVRELARQSGLDPSVLQTLNDPRGAYARLPFLFTVE